MKRLMSFLQCVLDDLGTWCHTSTDRDLKTVAARFEHEGWSFLTITLTNFGRDLEKGLDQGFVSDDLFAGFKRRGGLPEFAQGFLRNVFDPKTGRLLDEPSVTCVWALRQLTLMWGKINLPCSDARERKAINGFVECEKDLRESDRAQDPVLFDRFLRIGTLLWGDVLCEVDRKVHDNEITSRHGPGQTADRLVGNDKWRQKEWTWRLEPVFPHGEHLVSSWRLFSESLPDVQFLEPGAERPSRVVSVPKTLKSPRIIALEPACMQYVQQGLLAAFREAIDSRDTESSLIGWSSQMPNQHLAWQGSLFGDLATLDLSEASDRVSNQHVRGLLRQNSLLAEGVESCRSRKADVPDHGVVRLAKFASMGSALCFPFESMVFSTIVFVGIELALKRRLTRRDVLSFVGRVRVYGDDIIVPVNVVHSVLRTLDAFGLRVNLNKSFWTGKFRESCGKEFYDGVDVSVVRVRRLFPVNRTDVQELESTVSTRNQLYKAGLWKSARFLDGVIERLIPFPHVAETSPLLGRHSFLGYETQRNCPKLHRPLVRGAVSRGVTPVSKLEDYGALLKCFVTSSDLPVVDSKHLERSGRRVDVGINLRYGTPY